MLYPDVSATLCPSIVHGILQSHLNPTHMTLLCRRNIIIFLICRLS